MPETTAGSMAGNGRTRAARAAAAFTVVAARAGPAAAQQSVDGEWRVHGGDAGYTRYAALDQIDAGTVGGLRVAWRRGAVDASLRARWPALRYSNQLRSTPIRGDHATDTKGTLQLPGSVGGAEWGGAGFDPETGMLYVPSVTGAFAADLTPGNPDRMNVRYTRGTRAFPDGPRGLPLTKPPYGRITAIDMNTGELLRVERQLNPQRLVQRRDLVGGEASEQAADAVPRYGPNLIGHGPRRSGKTAGG